MVATVGRSQAQGAGSTIDPGSHRAPLGRVGLLMIVGFWTFMAVLTAANGLLDPRGRGLQPVLSSAPIALAFIESYLWAALTLLILWLSGRFSIERSNWLERVFILIGVGVLIAMCMEAVVGYLRFEVFAPLRGPPRGAPRGFDPLFGLTRLFWLDDLIVYFAVLAAGVARDYFLRFRVRQEEATRLQAQTAQLQAQLAQARLDALRTQLNPHFLFNTLHAVSTLVERDPRGVRRMIARLSELLRTTLDGSNEQEIPLEQELAFLDRYLEIMQIRFQGHLDVDRQVDPATRDALVPHLVLQPLVENAVKHGVSTVDGVGRIQIRTRREGERLVLTVRDSGPGLSTAAPEEGVGLRNTRERLVQLYGAAQSLTLRNSPEGGVVAEVTLPYHTGADLRTAAVATHS